MRKEREPFGHAHHFLLQAIERFLRFAQRVCLVR